MESVDLVLVSASEFVILCVDALVLATIGIATTRAAWALLRSLLRWSRQDKLRNDMREVWLDYARSLVAALTLQIGSDILESSIAPTWQAIAQLAAIAAIRTFLNYFLERDIREAIDHNGGADGQRRAS